jgi:hypothetical protein
MILPSNYHFQLQHHLLKISEPITPFVVQASVVAEVNALLLAPR